MTVTASTAHDFVRIIEGERIKALALLPRALHHYEMHYHLERNHHGKDNLLLFPRLNRPTQQRRKVRRRE
jgi:hypothetical protein